MADQTNVLSSNHLHTKMVSHPIDLEKTLDDALEQTLKMTGREGGGIYLLNEQTGFLKVAAYRGFNQELADQIDNLKVGEGFSGRVIQTGQPMVINQLAADPRLTRSAVAAAGFQAVAIVPITSQQKTLGTLFTITTGQRKFTDQDLNLLTAIGIQIGLAIENALLYEDALSRLAQVSALQETTRALVSTLELDELLDLIIQQATTLLRGDAGILNLVDWDRYEDEVVASYGSAGKVKGIRYSLYQDLSGWVALHNRPEMSNRALEDPRVASVVKEIYPLKNAVLAPLTSRDKVLGTLVVIDKLGGKEDFEQTDLDLLVAFANQAAAAIENARLYADERRRAEQFGVIAEVGRRLTLIPNQDELLHQVVQIIQKTFGYYHVAVGQVEGNEVVYRIGAGGLWDEPDFTFKPAHLKIGLEGISGWVAANGEPLLVPDVSKDSRYVWMQGSATRSELTVPIFVKEQVVGVLDVQSERLNAFDDIDRIVIQSLAHQVGAALENARLYEQSQQLAVIEERSRLARELHDAVTQGLFSASLIADALPAAWEKNPQEGRRLLQELRSLSRGALAEMRTLLLELRPSALQETSLEDLLRQIAEAAGSREGIPIHVLVEGEGTLPADVHIALYRITQEALNNIVKHARASHATVRLCYTCTEPDETGMLAAPGVLLTISDDGRGFDPTQAPSDRFGLGIMHERAWSIGASLTIDSHPGEGTQVSVLWEPGED
jgi:GAF domain-containing protein